ncbi:MAG: hypothetical protein JWR12_2957 [Mucilaginibacter sp.]|nr:hypothetical protein [Mucilaginibacter sp.]
MVEIFKTNVNNRKLAGSVLKELHTCFPTCCFNFDLDDCDRILRVQSDGVSIEITKIIQIVKTHFIEVSLLED